MGSDDEAQTVIRELDGAELDGRNITVSEARERQGTGGGGARSSRRGGARGSRGGGGADEGDRW
jgi:RNA recognition motif-containing protein